MELEYRFPGGTMTIHAGVFFKKARRRKIRKALKDYGESLASREEIERLEAWLIGKTQRGEGERERLEGLILKKSRELNQSQTVYDYYKNFRGKNARGQKARKSLLACRAEMRDLSTRLGQTRRYLGAYKRSLGDTRRILMAEEELE